MEKLKEEIRKELYKCALITQSQEGVGMSFTFDKQAEAVMKVIEPLLEADRIIRALAKAESVDVTWILAAQNYVANNPNKEGGEGES